MAQSSILGGERARQQARGRDTDALGPSDSSDSGSDVQGQLPFIATPEGSLTGADVVVENSDSDSANTGERASATSESVRDGGDIAPDRIEGSPDGDALDQEALPLDDPEAFDPADLAVDEAEGSADGLEDDTADDAKAA